MENNEQQNMTTVEDAARALEAALSEQQGGTQQQSGAEQAEAAQAGAVMQEGAASPAEQAAPDESEQLRSAIEQSRSIIQQNEQLQQQNNQLQQQMHDMYELIQEMNTANRAEALSEAMEDNTPAMPMLDVEGMAFMSPEEVQQKQAEYAQAMQEYMRSSIIGSPEISGLIDYAEQAKAERERESVLAELEGMPLTKDIRSYIPQMQNIIQNNPYLASTDMSEADRLLNAYAIARGANAINTPPPEAHEPTVDELMQYYNSNDDFRKAVEQARLAELKDSSKAPAFAPSDGAANVALNVQKQPERVENIGDMLFKKLRRN